MSGHSKWSKIKRNKGAKDAKRGVLFSKLSKKISLAVKDGGSGDPVLNFKLRTEIDAAKTQGLPNDNIDRAIKKGLGQDGGAVLEEIIYEGYGPYGTAFLIEVVTDSKNRAVSNVKHILSKHGGNLGASGSVAWQFETKGQILVERATNTSELELVAIDAGATDVEESEEGLAVYTDPHNLHAITDKLTQAGAIIINSEIIKESSQKINLDENQKDKIYDLIDALEDDEDVITVHSSASL
jgi:YebC/PmpR family DNA-binding regulatory protein